MHRLIGRNPPLSRNVQTERRATWKLDDFGYAVESATGWRWCWRWAGGVVAENLNLSFWGF